MRIPPLPKKKIPGAAATAPGMGTQTKRVCSDSCTKPRILKIHAILCGLINSIAAVLFGLTVLNMVGVPHV